jgi:hypothetical protein
MKIIEGDDDVMNIWLCEDDSITLMLHTEYAKITRLYLSPLEAHQLGTLLLKLANETDYFKGFSKNTNYCHSKEKPHPWAEFLRTRKDAVLWMKDEGKRNDEEIARILSMDEQQVFQIRTSKD